MTSGVKPTAELHSGGVLAWEHLRPQERVRLPREEFFKLFEDYYARTQATARTERELVATTPSSSASASQKYPTTKTRAAGKSTPSSAAVLEPIPPPASSSECHVCRTQYVGVPPGSVPTAVDHSSCVPPCSFVEHCGSDVRVAGRYGVPGDGGIVRVNHVSVPVPAVPSRAPISAAPECDIQIARSADAVSTPWTSPTLSLRQRTPRKLQ